MELDVEDIFAAAVGSVIGRFILFMIAVWVGCTVGGAGIVAGSIAEDWGWPADTIRWLWAAPLLLFSSWALLNVPFLIYWLMRFVRSEGDGYVAWGVVIAVESLVVMLGWLRDFVHGWLPLTVAWIFWFVVLVMAGTGLWMIRQHCINCWARELGMLRAANAQKLAEQEAEERERMKLEDLR